MRARPLLGPALALLFLASALAGCIAEGPADLAAPRTLASLAVYEYRYPGDDVVLRTVLTGWMALLSNPGQQTVLFRITPLDNATVWGPVLPDGWAGGNESALHALEPNGSLLFLFQAAYTEDPGAVGFTVDVLSAGVTDVRTASARESGTFTRNVTFLDFPMRIGPGHHVRTATVGVWTNGTSFYTNIAALHADPAFPRGYEADSFADALLPVYVYDKDRSEQPPSSKDNCHFVTIAGYNELLKTQGVGSTGVRFLQPEEAYTRPGAEEHRLYGDALIFLNTVVSAEGNPGLRRNLPDPSGDCFRIENTTGPLPVPVPPPPAER